LELVKLATLALLKERGISKEKKYAADGWMIRIYPGPLAEMRRN
jgi:hypothetical protein